MSLLNCRVVLVRTQFAGNLGSVARVLRNFGLSQLVLVAPEASRADRQARQLSTHGQDVLDRARVVATLDEAIADCVLVAGTSARVGGPYRRQSHGLPEEILPRLLDAAAGGAVALVLGPERDGLTNAEVTRCHYLIHIPADPVYPALNLAQAAAVCVYELRRAWLRRDPPGARSPAPAEPLAPVAVQERMFESLRTALEEVHFLYGEKAGPLMHALRHLLGRAGPTAMEVDVLFGLARQLRWVASRSEKRGLDP
jgi:tRNA/rRNA methyltransferase